MPIVASIGGNTGNQTVALVIRALALDQLREQHGQLIRKELTVSLVNGLTWGAVTGLLAFALYRNAALGAVMMTAVLLNLDRRGGHRHRGAAPSAPGAAGPGPGRERRC